MQKCHPVPVGCPHTDHRAHVPRTPPIAVRAIVVSSLSPSPPRPGAADTLITKAGTGTAGSRRRRIDGRRRAAERPARACAPRPTAPSSSPTAPITASAASRPTGRSPPSPAPARPAASATAARRSSPRSTARAMSPSRQTASPTTSPTAGGNRIRRVDAAGTITTVAGNGTAALHGRQRPRPPRAASTGPQRRSAVTPTGRHAHRRHHQQPHPPWSPPACISTVAGNGTAASTGDGSPANLASVNLPQDVAAAAGAYLIADTAGHRIRRGLDSGGTITTVVGTGTACAGHHLAGAATTAPAATTGRAQRVRHHRRPTSTEQLGFAGHRRLPPTDRVPTSRAPPASITTVDRLGAPRKAHRRPRCVATPRPAALGSLNAPRGLLDLPWTAATLVADDGHQPTCGPASPTRSPPHRPAPPAPPAPTGPTGATGLAGRLPAGHRRHRLAPQLAVAFASVKLTARAARPTTLRIVLTHGAVVQVRVARGRTVVVARRLSCAGGRKRLPLGLLTAGTYTVTVTATNGAGQATDHATLRVLPGR